MVDMHRHDGLLGAHPQEQPASRVPVSASATGFLPEQLPPSGARDECTGDRPRKCAPLPALESLARWLGVQAAKLAQNLLEMTPDQRALMRADYVSARPAG